MGLMCPSNGLVDPVTLTRLSFRFLIVPHKRVILLTVTARQVTRLIELASLTGKVVHVVARRVERGQFTAGSESRICDEVRLDRVFNAPSFEGMVVALCAGCGVVWDLWAQAVGAVPRSLRIRSIERIALEVDAPLAVHFDLHLEHKVSAVLIVARELGDILAHKAIRILAALVGSLPSREDKACVAFDIARVFVRQV